ncbi:MAG TPA: MarR family transcriptional regulator [Pseudonocardiaceae bacterium]|jgi:DNA-binding MarR family transcriptional regulator|nr:MarR family transcriptional regulator [Pseudonocardiaceae bacterium]
MSAEPCWLNAEEMRAWRAYVVGSQLLECQLNRELQDEHQLALADYELLVRLSEAPCGQIRMSTLAEQVASSKSRVSHQIGRMEKTGLVRRQDCPGDRRGVFAVLTSHGWDVLRNAAPTHVRGVRDHLVDLLSVEERLVLAGIFERVAERLRGQ